MEPNLTAAAGGDKGEINFVIEITSPLIRRIFRAAVARGVAAAVAAAMVSSAHGQPPPAPDVPLSFLVATYRGNAAARALDRVHDERASLSSGIRAIVVLSKDARGRVKASRRRSGDGVGRSIVRQAAALMSAPRGAGFTTDDLDSIDFLSGPTVGLPVNLVRGLKGGLEPGDSAILGVVEDRWISEFRSRLVEANLLDLEAMPLRPVTPR